MILRKTSWRARILMALPFRFYFIESCRVGQDCTTFVKVDWTKKEQS